MNVLKGPYEFEFCCGLTYFTACVGKPFVKIGRAWNKHRMVAVRGPNGEPVIGLLAIRGERLEPRFHAAFEDLHIGGEWFRLESKLINTINAIQTGTFDYGTLPETGWCVTKPYQTKASLNHWGPLPQYGRIAA